MDNPELERIARGWIACQQEWQEHRKDSPHWWANEKLWDLENSDPETLWKIILLINFLDQKDEVMANLAAGPLEMLLTKHGPQFIVRVEIEARRNRDFGFLLLGVWKNAMSDEIWSRVQIVRDRVNGDGMSHPA